MRHLDGGQRARWVADLIDLDEDGVWPPFRRCAARQARDIGDEEIVADKLAFAADLLGEQCQPPSSSAMPSRRHDRIIATSLER